MRVSPILPRFLLLLQLAVTGACVHPEAPAGAAPSVVTSDASEALRRDLTRIVLLTRRDGGATYDLRRHEPVSLGRHAFAASYAGGDTLPMSADDNAFVQALQAFVAKHDAYLHDPAVFLGTWKDPEAGSIAIDRTRLFDYTAAGRDGARRAALKFARDQEQKALFDLGSGQDVPVR
jgi:hypothetical protein